MPIVQSLRDPGETSLAGRKTDGGVIKMKRSTANKVRRRKLQWNLLWRLFTSHDWWIVVGCLLFVTFVHPADGVAESLSCSHALVLACPQSPQSMHFYSSCSTTHHHYQPTTTASRLVSLNLFFVPASCHTRDERLVCDSALAGWLTRPTHLPQFAASNRTIFISFTFSVESTVWSVP